VYLLEVKMRLALHPEKAESLCLLMSLCPGLAP